MRAQRDRTILAVGELRLPGGRAFLSFVISALAVVAIAIPASALLASARAVPIEPSAATERIADTRTDGERAVAQAQARLVASPEDPRAQTQLASAYLLRVRETADPTYYAKADALLARATASSPNDADVLATGGSLALSRHDFTAALELGRRAVAAAPARPSAYGVLVDALVELGRYDDAVSAAQRMVDLRPDLASLSRVSYLRELHGDLPGAIDAMRRAVQAGAPRGEATAWTEVQLGHLLFLSGDLDGASRAYASSLERVDEYVFGIAGIARVRAAKGDLSGAAGLYEDAAARMPVPDLVIALGDTYAALGDRARAAQQYALVGAMARLLAANGVRVDLDLALFDADHDIDATGAMRAARAEYAIRPSVHAADVLAWAEYKAGDTASAVAHSREALRLGSADPLLVYRAGVIAQAAGDAERGRHLLARSAALNPRASLLYAPDLSLRLGLR